MSDESENYVFRRSATVAQLPVKQLVAGSNPAAGAIKYEANFRIFQKSQRAQNQKS